jgi:lactate dehydrogenase-like 2-hydroxyacid dehydrogenase
MKRIVSHKTAQITSIATRPSLWTASYSSHATVQVTSFNTLICSPTIVHEQGKTWAKNLGVVGAGQMGAGIAQVAASVGKMDVLLMDSSQASIDKSMNHMRMYINKLFWDS